MGEVIVLAGGLGTRLRSEVPELPKCLAPVSGRPFLSYIINYLQKQQIQRFIFSLGYKSEQVEQYLFQEFNRALDYVCVVESTPLDTGGAIHLAMGKTTTDNVLIVNGDTYFNIDTNSLINFHSSVDAECTIALKCMQNFNRYGIVEVNESGSIFSFNEKKFYHEGLINGGVYLLNRNKFLNRSFEAKFSFEADYLKKFLIEKKFYGVVQDAYFIDIGIPEDFNRAQFEL
ncbi:MAG: nucleotidyltransferase [Sphingobacteriales bacterium]|nr:MAG: nucleotidyltransferase [Sphingobacteriales bacterium]